MIKALIIIIAILGIFAGIGTLVWVVKSGDAEAKRIFGGKVIPYVDEKEESK